MKKLNSFLALILIGTSVFAQSGKYEETMTKLVGEIFAQPYDAMLQPVANKMQRVADAEKDQWLPSYWVAYCYIQDSFKKTDPAERDQILDVAEKYLNQAAENAGDKNSEIEVLKASFASARLSIDGPNRYQEYGEKFQRALLLAGKYDPQNPRISYLEGTNAFYTPEAFGGGKKLAKPHFEKALDKFNNFTPETAYNPNWGKVESEYFLSQCN